MKRQRFSALAAALLAAALLLTSCESGVPGSPDASSAPSETSGAPGASSSSGSSDGSAVSGTASPSDASNAAASGLFPQAGMDELNQAWNRLFGANDSVYEDAFSSGFSYYPSTDYEVYWGDFLQNCILLREKAGGKWRLVDLGQYSTYGIDWMEARANPPVLFIRLSGVRRGGDSAFYDFPRNLEYDIATGKLSTTDYFNEQTGRFGGTSRLKQKFSSAQVDSDSVKLRFEVLVEDTNDGRSPSIEIDRDFGAKAPGTNYTLRFDYVEQNLTPEQLAAIAALPGIDSFRADYYDNSGFSGTAWSIHVKDGYKLRYFFETDNSGGEYASFRVQVVPSEPAD